MSLGDLLNVARSSVGLEGDQTKLGLTQQGAVHDYIGSLTDSVKDKTALKAALLMHSRNNPSLPWGIYQRALDHLPDTGPSFKKGMTDFLNMSRGSAGAAEGVTGTPTKEGAITTQPGTVSQYERRGIGTGTNAKPADATALEPMGGQRTGMAPGYEKSAGSAVERANTLQGAGDQVPEMRRMLSNMRTDWQIAKDKFGPTSEAEKVLNAGLQRWVGKTLTMSKDELAASESFDKVARQIAMQQAGQLHATDLTTTTALGANPSTKMSALGVDGIINMLDGNTDAIAAKYHAWNDFVEKNPGKENQYNSWSRQWNKDIDLRAFQYARMSKEQRVAFRQTIPEKEQKSFFEKLVKYEKDGMIAPLTQ